MTFDAMWTENDSWLTFFNPFLLTWDNVDPGNHSQFKLHQVQKLCCTLLCIPIMQKLTEVEQCALWLSCWVPVFLYVRWTIFSQKSIMGQSKSVLLLGISCPLCVAKVWVGKARKCTWNCRVIFWTESEKNSVNHESFSFHNASNVMQNLCCSAHLWIKKA